MKKIMFNDRYGLTKAVLEGRKTMTRRIVKGLPDVHELRINYGVCTLRYTADASRFAMSSVQPRHKIGEVVAVAQSYLEAYDELLADEDWENHRDKWHAFRRFLFDGEDHTVLKGWKNKMFVKSEVMPNRIRITDIKVERLQDISDDDCMKEGVQRFTTQTGVKYIGGGCAVSEDDVQKISMGRTTLANSFNTPREAFAALIDKVSGKGTWERNPWVFAYSFELLEGGDR